MGASDLKRIGDLQLQILRALWSLGATSIRDVVDYLHRGGSEHAYTTIATMLKKMEGRGLVERLGEGRQQRYRASVSEPELRSGALSDMLERLFTGSLSGLVRHALGDQKIDSEELDELERVIAQHKSNPKKRPKP